MKFITRLTIAALLLLCGAPMASAQSMGTLVGLGNIVIGWLEMHYPGQFHTETTYRCVNMRWMKTVTVTVDTPILIDTFTDTTDAGPCPCPKKASSNIETAMSPLSLAPRDENNCGSNGTQGQQGSYDNAAAPGNSSGGSPGGVTPILDVIKFGERGAPPPLQGMHQTVPQKLTVMPQPRERNHASAGPPPFTYTLPYRTLGAAPLLNSTSPTNVTATCNTQLNPTMLAVAHIDATVTRYNLCNSQLLATIPVGPLPLQIRVTLDGSQAIVTNYQNAITFIDLSTNAVSSVITTDSSFTPSGVAISPDGTYALVTNYEPPPDAFLAVLDIATKKITSTIPLDTEFPQSVFINPDGTLAWVTFPWDNVVEVIDLLTGTVIERLAVSTPYSVAFNATGTVAYIAGGETSGSVEVVNTSNYSMITTIPAGAGAGDLLVDPGEAFVSVNNAFDQSVTVFSPQALKGTTTPVGGSPRGTVLVPTQ